MSKKQKGLIIGIIAVILIGFIFSKSSTYIKTDIKVDSTEVKLDTTKVDSLKK